MKILREYSDDTDDVILEQYDDPWGNTYYFLLDESKNEIKFASSGPHIVKNFQEFIKRHPFMTGVAVSAGLGAIDTYQSNKRMTTRLFDQNQIEKKLYADMAKELAATGKYTIIKNGKRIKNGWLWELKRRGSF